MHRGLADSTHRTYNSGVNRHSVSCLMCPTRFPYLRDYYGSFVAAMGPTRPSPKHSAHLSGSDSTHPGRGGIPRASHAVVTTMPPTCAERRVQGPGSDRPTPVPNPIADTSPILRRMRELDRGRRRRHVMGSGTVVLLRILPCG